MTREHISQDREGDAGRTFVDMDNNIPFFEGGLQHNVHSLPEVPAGACTSVIE